MEIRLIYGLRGELVTPLFSEHQAEWLASGSLFAYILLYLLHCVTWVQDGWRVRWTKGKRG